MPDITVSISHALTRKEAQRRIANRTTQLHHARGQMQLHDSRWKGDRLDFEATVRGVTVVGQLRIKSKAVCITVELPWLLSPFTSIVKTEIARHGRELLSGR